MMQASTYNCAFWTMQKPAGNAGQQQHAQAPPQAQQQAAPL
jgi:hypothetical protein